MDIRHNIITIVYIKNVLPAPKYFNSIGNKVVIIKLVIPFKTPANEIPNPLTLKGNTSDNRIQVIGPSDIAKPMTVHKIPISIKYECNLV